MYKFKEQNLYLLSFILFLAVISLFIIKNFIVPIIFTAILVYIFHPAYNKLILVLRSHMLTSFILVIFILSLIIIPTVFTYIQISKEFSTLDDNQIQDSLDKFSININERYGIDVNLTKEYTSLVTKSKTYVRNTLFNAIPIFIFNLFIIIFLFYYFLKNYQSESTYFEIIFRQKMFKGFKEKIDKLINGIILGQILVRLIQSAIGTALFLFIGVKGAIIWGILMFFAAFLPVVGTALIWGPLMIVSIVNGNYDAGIYLFITGLIVSTIDNLLLPLFIADKTNMGPVITLISIIGGLQLFGIYGLILGPFFLGLLFIFFEEFIFQFKEDNPEIKRYVWSDEERKKYRKLKTEFAKQQFIRMIDKRYKKDEMLGEEVKFRYVMTESKQ